MARKIRKSLILFSLTDSTLSRRRLCKHHRWIYRDMRAAGSEMPAHRVLSGLRTGIGGRDGVAVGRGGLKGAAVAVNGNLGRNDVGLTNCIQGR